MKVCSADSCILPARWIPRAIVKSGTHWPNMPARTMLLPVCFCEVHRASSTLDKLFSHVARQHLDMQFCKQKWAPIDWSRTVIEWDQSDPRDGKPVEFPPENANGSGPGESTAHESEPGGTPI